MSAGAEEANALIQLGEGARSDPNLRATQIELSDGLIASSQNCWPSVEFDISIVNNFASRLLPSGFYYKTFMWPASLWMTYERVIRKAAGLGKAPEGPDPDRYDKTFAHCDVLVAGGGPAGLAAALSAGRGGARVILAEQDNSLGGNLLSETDALIEGQSALAWVEQTRTELEAMANVQVLTRTQVYGYFDHNFIGLMENLTDHLPLADRPANLPRHRLWKLRAKQVVLATGSIERPLVFSDNDRPGIMLASACRTYLNRYGVKPGNRAVIFTNNDGAYAAALDLQKAGVQIAAIVDLRADPQGPLTEQAREAGLRILPGHAITATAGDKRIKAVQVAPLSENGDSVKGSGEEIACDLVAVSGGWNPTVHLHSQSRGKIVFDDAYACFIPGATAQASATAGACSGSFGLGSALSQGHAAGLAAATALGFDGKAAAAPSASDRDFLPARWLWLVPGDKPLGHGGKHFVDVQNDVTAADLHLALREGYRSIEHVKRYTTTGMGTDQGKTSNVNAIAIVSQYFGCPIPDVGVTTFRPPYTPVTFGVFAGRDIGDLLDPVRKTPMHALHEQAGAVFEDVGQWKRPWYFPQGDEDMHASVNREVRACRDSLGVMDATTLGKIDIQGKDAAEFLNRVYTNAWLKLKVGSCRYGLMLGEDGMVADDGVTSRLAENHFLMTTTTGNAAAVLGHLEEFLQTEWPELEVYLTSVTEQFATVSFAGPNARNLLAELTDDIDLSAEAFPFMTFRKGTVAGIPARVFRISFTGDLSYEINVPTSYGAALWQAVMTAGEKYAITPYGTEAMHVLRAEKGFIIVGQETDGSVTPFDLGMDWVVSRTKDFVGRRSLYRSDMDKPDRKQLVGLLTDQPDAVLPEGAQLVEKVENKPVMTMLGHVTSSYHSPNVGRSIAMALIKGGRARMGEKLYAPLADGKVLTCTVTDTVFFDKEGERSRG
jgi:sarcosine oxidase subunit alpha